MEENRIGKVVIIGGGIIGCSVAYHLAELGVPSTVVERCSVACAASGKAGGFLSRTMCDGSPLEALATASYDLHTHYGSLFDVDYRPLDTLKIMLDEKGIIKRKPSAVTIPEWVDSKDIINVSALGNTSTSAQVHPEKLSQAFLRASEQKGTTLIIAQATGLTFSEDGRTVVAVELHEKPSVPCDIVVLAMGPWTDSARHWLNKGIPRIMGQRAHSIILKPKEQISAHALFVQSPAMLSDHPEVYPRPDGTVYVCGVLDPTPLPGCPDEVKPDITACVELYDMARSISSSLRDADLLKQQACYLPISERGLPSIGRLPEYDGVYIAAGHSCWGILNAPATGKALAELIVRGKSSIDLSAFEPE